MLTWGAGMHPKVWHCTNLYIVLESGQKLDNSLHVAYIY